MANEWRPEELLDERVRRVQELISPNLGEGRTPLPGLVPGSYGPPPTTIGDGGEASAIKHMQEILNRDPDTGELFENGDGRYECTYKPLPRWPFVWVGGCPQFIGDDFTVEGKFVVPTVDMDFDPLNEPLEVHYDYAYGTIPLDPFELVTFIGAAEDDGNSSVLAWPVGVEADDLAFIVTIGQGGSVAFDDPGFLLIDAGDFGSTLYGKVCTGGESGNIGCTGTASFDRRAWALIVVRGGSLVGQAENSATTSHVAPSISVGPGEMAVMISIGVASIVSGTVGPYGAPYVNVANRDDAGGKHSVNIDYWSNIGDVAANNPANSQGFSGSDGAGYQWALKIGAA